MTTRKDTSPMTVETGGKLYLFTSHSPQDYENAKKGYSRSMPGKPLSKAECLRLARTLLNHALQGSRTRG